MNSHRDERVFLVRMWREGEPSASRQASAHRPWRGSIHDVATSRRFYVTSAEQITDFIADSLETSVELAEPRDESAR